jgi:capsular exopolysaccharide synthesis family protein
MSRIEEALRRANVRAPEMNVAAGVDTSAAVTEWRASADLADVDQYRSEVDQYRSEYESAQAAAEPLPDWLVASDEPPSLPSVPPRPAFYDNEKLVVNDDAAPIFVEQYRKVAAALHKTHTERPSKIVMVASAMAGEGKTLTAANLALTLSESFRRQVLLIDADLRRPTVHQAFRLSNDKGLNDALSAKGEEKLPLCKVSDYLTVLPAGRPNSDPMGGLASERMQRIVEEAGAKFDWVVLDTPPIGLLPDANLLADMVDMVVLVIGAGTTPLPLIQQAVKALDRTRIVGVVLNRVVESQAAYQYYDYYRARVS